MISMALFLSIGFSQRIMLFTKTNDIFSSSNKFTIKKKKLIFWQDKVVLTTVPIKSLVEVRYAEKSYYSLGKPCTIVGGLAMASAAGASAAGQMTDEYMIGIGGGLGVYILGKTLNLIGARFGRDIVYQNFDRIDYSTQKLIPFSCFGIPSYCSHGALVNSIAHHNNASPFLLNDLLSLLVKNLFLM